MNIKKKRERQRNSSVFIAIFFIFCWNSFYLKCVLPTLLTFVILFKISYDLL